MGLEVPETLLFTWWRSRVHREQLSSRPRAITSVPLKNEEKKETEEEGEN